MSPVSAPAPAPTPTPALESKLSFVMEQSSFPSGLATHRLPCSGAGLSGVYQRHIHTCKPLSPGCHPTQGEMRYVEMANITPACMPTSAVMVNLSEPSSQVRPLRLYGWSRTGPKTTITLYQHHSREEYETNTGCRNVSRTSGGHPQARRYQAGILSRSEAPKHLVRMVWA